jgi:hypothetical protein
MAENSAGPTSKAKQKKAKVGTQAVPPSGIVHNPNPPRPSIPYDPNNAAPPPYQPMHTYHQSYPPGLDPNLRRQYHPEQNPVPTNSRQKQDQQSYATVVAPTAPPQSNFAIPAPAGPSRGRSVAPVSPEVVPKWKSSSDKKKAKKKKDKLKKNKYDELISIIASGSKRSHKTKKKKKETSSSSSSSSSTSSSSDSESSTDSENLQSQPVKRHHQRKNSSDSHMSTCSDAVVEKKMKKKEENIPVHPAPVPPPTGAQIFGNPEPEVQVMAQITKKGRYKSYNRLYNIAYYIYKLLSAVIVIFSCANDFLTKLKKLLLSNLMTPPI